MEGEKEENEEEETEGEEQGGEEEGIDSKPCVHCLCKSKFMHKQTDGTMKGRILVGTFAEENVNECEMRGKIYSAGT